MTLRERIADWISGGALTQSMLQCEMKDESFKAALGGWDAQIVKCDEYMHALNRISCMETPGAAPTAKKMVAVANEALDLTGGPVKVKP